MERKFNYTVTSEDVENGYDVKDIMRKHFSFSSRLRTKIKKNNSVTVNDVTVPVWITPKVGDVINVTLPEESSYFPPEDIPIDIVFEDQDLLILNKQPGITVHPTKGQPDHTLANAVAKYQLDSDQAFKIRFVNRLDMDTSGLIVLGKNSFVQDDFVKQSRQNLVTKEYTAIVDGIIEEERGVIDAPIGRKEDEPYRRDVLPTGKPSVTHYQVLERFPAKDGGTGFTMVRLRLETGRTHQIRVHMEHIGHPVTGDWLYESNHRDLIARQALHATNLSFKHPVTGEMLHLHADLPGDMEELLAAIK